MRKKNDVELNILYSCAAFTARVSVSERNAYLMSSVHSGLPSPEEFSQMVARVETTRIESEQTFPSSSQSLLGRQGSPKYFQCDVEKESPERVILE